MTKKKKNIPFTRSLKLISEKNMPFDYVESYKSLRTNLKFITAASNAKSFVITSALGMESKSNISINLAITLAEENKKVVLVDGDLRKPVIHRFLKVYSHGMGLSNVITGEIDLEDALTTVEKLKIDILPVGVVPPNPTELLSQERMKEILEELKQNYDYVIVDAPPISVVTDAAIIGGMVDGALLVVRSDYAPVEMVRLAKKKLDDVNVTIFGVILSRFDAKKSSRQSGYYYSYNGYYNYSYSYDGKSQ